MEAFTAYGVHDFYLSVHYKSRIMKSFFEELEPPFDVQFVYEDEPRGTAGALRALAGKLTTDLIVTNCDVIIRADYHDLVTHHERQGNDVTLVVSLKNYRIPYGVCEIEDGGVLKEIREKPEYDFLVNTGLYVLKPATLDLIPADTVFHITDLIAAVMARGGKVGVYPISDAAWTDTGEWAEYRTAVAALTADRRRRSGNGMAAGFSTTRRHPRPRRQQVDPPQEPRPVGRPPPPGVVDRDGPADRPPSTVCRLHRRRGDRSRRHGTRCARRRTARRARRRRRPGDRRVARRDRPLDGRRRAAPRDRPARTDLSVPQRRRRRALPGAPRRRHRRRRRDLQARRAEPLARLAHRGRPDRPPSCRTSTRGSPVSVCPSAFQLNGAVYAFRADRLRPEHPSILFGRTAAVVMPPERSVDIDGPLDLVLAQTMVERGGSA